MIRATVLRALVLTAAFAAGLTPVTCLGENSNRLPTKATKELRHIFWPDLIYDRHRFVERFCDAPAKRPHWRASLRKPHPEHRGMKPGFSN
jgi:hypothetical protein